MPRLEDVQLIIFDQDGTLVDSHELNYTAVSKVAQELGYELPLDLHKARSLVGLPSEDYYKQLLPKELVGRWEEIREKAREWHPILLRELVRPFPHVRETLEELRERGYTLVLYTNGSRQYFEMVQKHFGFYDLFHSLHSVQDNDQTKKGLIKDLRLRYGDIPTAIVGDTREDVESAEFNGSLSIGVRYGYDSTGIEHANFFLSSFRDLLALFDPRRPLFTRISTMIGARKAKDQPIVVGLSGVDTSGKTHFTSDLTHFLRYSGFEVQEIRLDDFHNPRNIRYAGDDEVENYLSRSFDLGTLTSKVLAPIRLGMLDISLTMLNLHTDTYSVTRRYHIDENTIVLLEGVFLFRQELQPYIDFKIFLHVPFDEVWERVRKRDVPLYGEGILEKYSSKYIPAQEQYLSEYPPEEVADLIINNQNYMRPEIIFEKV